MNTTPQLPAWPFLHTWGPQFGYQNIVGPRSLVRVNWLVEVERAVCAAAQPDQTYYQEYRFGTIPKHAAVVFAVLFRQTPATSALLGKDTAQRLPLLDGTPNGKPFNAYEALIFPKTVEPNFVPADLWTSYETRIAQYYGQLWRGERVTLLKADYALLSLRPLADDAAKLTYITLPPIIVPFAQLDWRDATDREQDDDVNVEKARKEAQKQKYAPIDATKYTTSPRTPIVKLLGRGRRRLLWLLVGLVLFVGLTALLLKLLVLK